MAYTFTRINEFTIDDTFNQIYADSLDDIRSGTIASEHLSKSDTELKEYMQTMMNASNFGYNVIVSKDDVPCLYIHGMYENNTYTWRDALVGKINNSKAWTWTSEFHEANKSWIQSLGGTKFALLCIKDSRIDTYFTQATTDGICLGTLTTEDLDNNTKRMTWEY